MRSLIGKKAPSVHATAVVNGNRIVENFTLAQYEGEKYVVLFFYPMDFTFVCPTELHAFQEKLEEFEARGVQVVGCSVDSEYSHLAWLGQPRSKGGIEGVKYPILADTTKTIAENYGVLGGEYLSGEHDELVFEGGVPVAYRGLFLIEKRDRASHGRQRSAPRAQCGRGVAYGGCVAALRGVR
jgi:peroxiredoxin (alkyl hydroperoxide reductase subunit C)